MLQGLEQRDNQVVTLGRDQSKQRLLGVRFGKVLGVQQSSHSGLGLLAVAEPGVIGAPDRQSLRAILGFSREARNMAERVLILTLSQKQYGALVICFDIRRLIFEHSLVDLERLALRLRIGWEVLLI